MLFTDAAVSSLADLVAYESEVEELAVISNLDLDTKLRLAQTEVGVELLAATVPRTAGDGQTSSFGLNQVVVTDALRLWHTFHTLAIVYRDAYNRKLNDKHLPKWNEYQSLAKWAANLYFNIGVGLVNQPLSAPAAPAVSAVAGGALPETSYFVRVTWSNVQDVESGPSPAVSFTVPANQLLSVSVAALTVPERATGWFPYAGTTAGSEKRQVTVALAPAAAWTLPVGGLVSGAEVPDGQAPDLFRQVARALQRG